MQQKPKRRAVRGMRVLLCVAVTLTAMLATGCGHRSRRNNHAEIPMKELQELKATIKAAPTYVRDIEARFDSLRSCMRQAATAETRFNYALQLSQEYMRVNTDSAVLYAEEASRLAADGSAVMRQRSVLTTINALSAAGIFTEARPLFDSLGRAGLAPGLKAEYWWAGRTLYGYMRTYVEGQEPYRREYDRMYLSFDDSLMRSLPADHQMRRFLEGERLVTDGNITVARQRLEELLKELPEESNFYGMTAFQLAEVYKASGDTTTYAAYLARSAMSDVKGCVREGLALPTFAVLLYNNGDLDDAFGFINFALEDAMRGNARMRTVSIARMVPLIDTAYREKISSSRDELMVYALLSTFMFAITFILVIVLVRSSRASRLKERKLATLSKLQESYIGHFIALCSTYADRLDSLTKTVSRKLQSGQQEELLKLVQSGKFADYHNEKFFSMFDQAFLDIYPDFVNGVNALLRPEERIEMKPGEPMSPELRIYAFVRLGVSESTRIAQILHYSVSTVYAYRNRMRNRALDRPNFDRDVMDC